MGAFSFFERRTVELMSAARTGFEATSRAFRILSMEVVGMHMAVYILAASAFFSSLLALVRDRLLAHYFGAGITLDLYYTAFRIPDFIFVAIGALVSVYVLIPELTRRTEEEQRSYLDTVIAGFSVLVVVVAGCAALVAPWVLGVLFPNFGDGFSTLVLLTRIILLQPILLGLSNIFAAITQIRHRYLLYSLSPLLYNAGIIFGVVVLYPIFGIVGLAYGVVLGALLHAAIQVPSIVRDGFFRRLPVIRESRALMRTMKISIPRALALSMNQFAFIGLTALAGMLMSGSIAVFMFAYNLQAVPLAIIGASYSVAAFPVLAKTLAEGETAHFIAYIAAAARYVVFWSLPVIALVIVLRAHLVRVILGSGAFDWTDTRLTAAAFALFSISLAAQGLQLLLVRGYYAAGRTLVPFMISFVSALGTVGLGAVLIGLFNDETAIRVSQALLRVTDVPGSRVLVLAFAYASVALLATGILLIHFERHFRGFFSLVVRSWLESIFAALVVGIVTYAALVLLGPIGFASTTLTVLARGLIGGLLGLAAGALAYAAMNNREYREVLSSIRTRRWREVPRPAEEAFAQAAEEGGPTTPQ